MKSFELEKIVRPNILSLTPYSCARNEFTGVASVYLDANENPYDSGVNRYPDPLQTEVKSRLAAIKGVKEGEIFLGNGSDEAIDLIYRVFCRPGVDNVVAPAPTYGMYQVAAEVNDVSYRSVSLREGDFSLDLEALKSVMDVNTRVVWLCSPNNPTGNLLSQDEMLLLLETFTQGVVVVDEAYIDFALGTASSSASAEGYSWITQLDRFPNLIVLQTFSKAWGLAGLRLGMAFADESIISLFNRVKYPYNVSVLTQRDAIEVLDNIETVNQKISEIISERNKLARSLCLFPWVLEIYPSEANFLLVKVQDADFVYDFLCKKGIIVRNRNQVTLCHGCLRITVGTPVENEILMEACQSV